jgi:hypothetical protein
MYQPIDAKGNKSKDVGGNDKKEKHEVLFDQASGCHLQKFE